MATELSNRDATMADPYTAIIEDMQTNPEDAAVLAEYVDPSVIVKALKQINYNVQRKIEILGEIIKSGTNTEKMRAMKELDAIREASLARRGIFVSSNPVPPGVQAPLGLPQGLESLKISQTQTTKTATLTMRQQLDALPEAEEAQPLQENEDHGEEQDDNPGDDTYHEDNRGSNPNIFRPATTQHGQGNANGW